MKRLNCKIQGHTLVKIKSEDVQLKNFECTHCKQEFTTDGYGRVVKLTKFWQENNKLFEDYFKQRVLS